MRGARCLAGRFLCRADAPAKCASEERRSAIGQSADELPGERADLRGRVFGTIGLPELLLILLIVVIVFGAGKLPQLGRGLGEGIRNFKKELKGDKQDANGGGQNDEGSKQG